MRGLISLALCHRYFEKDIKPQPGTVLEACTSSSYSFVKMPIVVSTVFSNTPGTISRDNEYSHSAIFTTAATSFESLNIPPLREIWTAPASCHDRWMLATERSSDKEVLVVYSTYPENAPSDRLYKECQRYGAMPTYSPGVCPDGQTIAEVTKFLHHDTTGIESTFWQASCCNTLVNMI